MYCTCKPYSSLQVLESPTYKPQPNIQNARASTKAPLTAFAFSHPFPARLEALLVRVGVAAVATEVGDPDVLEALAVWVVSAAGEEGVIMLGVAVLEEFSGAQEVEIGGMELEGTVLDGTPLEETDVDDMAVGRVVL